MSYILQQNYQSDFDIYIARMMPFFIYKIP